MDDQQEKEKIFKQLISQVVTEAKDNFSLDEVKDFYAIEINSARSLYKAKSLRGVLQLLEHRDLLSCQKVTPLLSLGELLSNERIKELVRCYIKTCLDEDVESCDICGSFALNPAHAPLSEHNGNQNCVPNTRNNIGVDSLNAAFVNVASTIGKKWVVLARELDLKEIQIERCIEAHPEDYVSQAMMALKLWRRKEKENASLDRLDRALDARLCKIKGIGVYLRQPTFEV